MKRRRNNMPLHWGWLVLAALTILSSVQSLPAAKTSAGNDQLLVYIGTYTGRGSEGIYIYRLALKSGRLTPLGTVSGLKNPSFLAVHPNHRYLYCVNESAQFHGQPAGAISSFAIDQHNGLLRRLNEQSSVGKGPCFVEVDHAGRHVLAANYGGGSVVVLPIRDDGSLGPATAFVQHHGASVHARQKGPHAHAIYTDANDRFVIVPDLGLDKLMIYRYDDRAGTLAPNPTMPAAKLAPASGPRHFAFRPDGKFAYAISELASTITVFRYDGVRGTLTTLQTVSTLPPGFHGHNTTAEIVVSSDGRFVYGSNRGADSIAVFAIDADTGKLTLVSHHKTKGKTPRNFALDPTGRYLLAANQDSDNVVVFRIDPANGKLLDTDQQIHVSMPVCVVMIR